MKKIVLILSSVIILLACNKNNDNKDTKPFLTAKVDGVAKTCLQPMAIRDTNSGIISINVEGKFAEFEGLSVMVSKNGGITTGNYGGASAQVYIATELDQYKSGTDGTVTITAIDSSHIEGRFSGTVVSQSGAGSRVVTDGGFYSKYYR